MLKVNKKSEPEEFTKYKKKNFLWEILINITIYRDYLPAYNGSRAP